jgi:predicted nucleotidyltransferase
LQEDNGFQRCRSNMTGREIRRRLADLLPTVKERYGVVDLWVFGSVARDESTDRSDLDLIVEFDGPATFERYMGLKFFLEDTLGVRVDLATRRALHPRLRDRIEHEAVHVS